VYESEAAIIQVIGDMEACSRFIKEGVNWDDPKRDPASLTELPVRVKPKKMPKQMKKPI
jgi:hypothetical protein